MINFWKIVSKKNTNKSLKDFLEASLDKLLREFLGDFLKVSFQFLEKSLVVFLKESWDKFLKQFLMKFPNESLEDVMFRGSCRSSRFFLRKSFDSFKYIPRDVFMNSSRYLRYCKKIDKKFFRNISRINLKISSEIL